MADGSIAMQAQIERLRQLTTITDRSVAPVGRAIRSEVVRQVRSGQGPDGKSWTLTEDGKVPLKNADKYVEIKAIGKTIVLSLDGHHARHHLGAVRGKVKREIIPTGKIPDPITRAINRVVTSEFRKIMEPK